MALPKEIPREGIDQSHQVILSRFEWTYQNKPQQRDIAIFVAEVLAELINVMPVDTACSFAGKGHHEVKMNQYVLLWMTAFKKSKEKDGKVKIAGKEEMKEVVQQGTSFLLRQNVEAIKDNTTNIAD